MKCCKPEQNASGEKTGQPHNCGGGIKHMLLMLVCCLAPLGLVLFLQQSGNFGGAGYLVLLLCRLMHLFMMRGMGQNQQNKAGNKESGQS